jgi:hypothetical protein
VRDEEKMETLKRSMGVLIDMVEAFRDKLEDNEGKIEAIQVVVEVS